jgi:hypothetical protein
MDLAVSIREKEIAMIGIETAGLLILSGMYAGLVVSQISGAGQRQGPRDPAERAPQPARSAVVGGDYLDPTETDRRIQVEQVRWRLLC